MNFKRSNISDLNTAVTFIEATGATVHGGSVSDLGGGFFTFDICFTKDGETKTAKFGSTPSTFTLMDADSFSLKVTNDNLDKVAVKI